MTDLEGAALAEIAQRGSMTCYALANAFSGSPSEFWSGSAGAVYPMVERLRKKGFVEATAGRTGKRSKQDYSITPTGRAALEKWLLDADRASGMGFDPLRTRLLYLGLVSDDRRTAFLADVAHRSEAHTDEPPVFAGRDDALRIHRTWWQARKIWLSLLIRGELDTD